MRETFIRLILISILISHALFFRFEVTFLEAKHAASMQKHVNKYNCISVSAPFGHPLCTAGPLMKLACTAEAVMVSFSLVLVSFSLVPLF